MAFIVTVTGVRPGHGRAPAPGIITAHGLNTDS
jgi:hypothetical protein